MILPVEASGAHAGPADAIFEIMHDITLTMGEKLLLIEGLFVHDCAPSPTDPSVRFRVNASKPRVNRGYEVSGER